jgi:hypothetical protein
MKFQQNLEVSLNNKALEYLKSIKILNSNNQVQDDDILKFAFILGVEDACNDMLLKILLMD